MSSCILTLIRRVKINVVAFACDRSISWGARPLPIGHPWVAPRTNAELLAEYEGWGPDIQLLLSCIPQPSVWSIHAVHSPLESYSRGRAALLGDAAHGMLPHLGAGAGQGLEDVLVLVKLLGHPNATNENIEVIRFIILFSMGYLIFFRAFFKHMTWFVGHERI